MHDTYISQARVEMGRGGRGEEGEGETGGKMRKCKMVRIR